MVKNASIIFSAQSLRMLVASLRIIKLNNTFIYCVNMTESRLNFMRNYTDLILTV